MRYPSLGYRLGQQGVRASVSPVDRLCGLSEAKVAAAVHILEAEDAVLGPALRALVLCDFERLPARLPASLRETPIDEDSGSARLVFATLASADVGGVGALRPLLVTGQTFACAAELAAELVQRFQRAGHQVSVQPLDGAAGACRIVGSSDRPSSEAFVANRIGQLLGVDGDRSPESFHRELGEIMWEHCGVSRTDAGLCKALERIPELREEFWRRIRIPGSGQQLNQTLEKANRVADHLELAELTCLDALHRTESCGGHFREESQTLDGEAARDDEHFSYVAAWESTSTGTAPVLHREALDFNYVHPTQRSYA